MQELLDLFAKQKSKSQYIKAVEAQLFTQEKKLTKLGYKINYVEGLKEQQNIEPGHLYPIQNFIGTRFIYRGLKGDWSKDGVFGEEFFSEIKNTASIDFQKLPD